MGARFMKNNILITAGLTGIGKEISKLLAGNGFNTYHTTSRIDQVDEQTFYWNMKDLNSSKDLITQLKNKNIHIDGLIHCAHIFSPAQPIFGINSKTFSESLLTNILPCFELSKGLAKLMARRNYGRIIFIGSMAAIKGSPGKLSYIVEKNALNGLAVAFNSELKEKNVLTKILHPGLTDTEQIRKRLKQEILDIIGEDNLLSPLDVANKVHYLLKNSEQQTIFHMGDEQSW
ncbi:MAG: hypothetical protein CME66_10080 [Halobacteriovoraceae bacterium]|jgi:short-subunit dehydrogenase|nr:hypothetical protein [Halobacteriovoraceae bacterium]